MPKVRVRFGEQTTTTANVAYVPKPFPTLTPGHLIDPKEVKSRESCMKAMRDHAQGKITKKELDRICKG